MVHRVKVFELGSKPVIDQNHKLNKHPCSIYYDTFLFVLSIILICFLYEIYIFLTLRCLKIVCYIYNSTIQIYFAAIVAFISPIYTKFHSISNLQERKSWLIGSLYM